jgi:hypothetical protein
MSELRKQQRQAPSLKLIEILEDGSTKTDHFGTRL